MSASHRYEFFSKANPEYVIHVSGYCVADAEYGLSRTVKDPSEFDRASTWLGGGNEADADRNAAGRARQELAEARS